MAYEERDLLHGTLMTTVKHGQGQQAVASCQKLVGDLVSERFPNATTVLLGGSVVRGDATSTSDLDVVVIDESLPAARRETHVRDGWPVEVFAYTTATFAEYLERGWRTRLPVVAQMCAEAVIVVDRHGTASGLQARVRALLEAGPPEPTTSELQSYRYRLTNLRDDLADTDQQAERVFLGLQVARVVTELALLRRRCWLGTGKWLPRLVARVDPSLLDSLLPALAALVARNDPQPLLDLIDLQLVPVGGPLLDGYSAQSPDRLPDR